MADQEPLEASPIDEAQASHEAQADEVEQTVVTAEEAAPTDDRDTEPDRGGPDDPDTREVAESAELPARIRVHALAKLLRTTSKRILAHLTELGVDARSPQSSVDRTVAESVRDALLPADTELPLEELRAEELRTDELRADELRADEAAAERNTPAEPGEAPGAQEPGASALSLFTSPFQPQPPAEQPAVFGASAVVAAPLFLPPDAAAAETARRRRRTEPTPTPTLDSDETSEDVEEPAEPSQRPPAGESDEGGRSRRRRRGRRGRGRGRGEQSASDDAADDDESDTEDSAESSSDEGGDVPEGASRRRRRRRRRKAGEDADDVSEDDPPNTVVHEREPRNKRRISSDEVQGISGSTRLEAKRQRRRDGREAGRRRPPILSESEFLARREAVDRVMVVREKSFPAQPAATIQVAVLEDQILVEHFVTSAGQASMVGNVYLGRVQNVLSSMEAAFVDIGRGRNGVLYAGEVNWEAAGLGGKERKIEQALVPGQTVLVQVSKDPVGHKGARLTTQISLAGRFLVYVPGGSSTGISRKLPDNERKRLKKILRDIVPADAGVIIRTASEGVSETELARDVERLQSTWQAIEEQSRAGSAPKTLYEEPDLLVKVVRDLFNEDFSRLVIEGDQAWTTVEGYIRTVAPDLLDRVQRYEPTNGVDVFGSFRIDEQLAKAMDRKVWLPSGGTLVIDRTEAMTVIDVNTGKFTGAGGSNLEETVTRNNLEAAEEIVRQMRLRDIGGMIVVDFIDMVLESNRDLVLRRLTECLGRDRTRHQVSEVTSLGLVQMTRKKLGTGLVEAFSTACEHCRGRGIVLHGYPVQTAPVEEPVGRRESRRRRKEKVPTVPVPPVTSESQEVEAATRRAHPVALAMAAHHGDDDSAAHAEVAGTNGAAAAAAVSAPPEQVAAAAELGRGEGVVSNGVEGHEDHGDVRRGRRRVARTTALPGGDSASAVFVVSSEQAGPGSDFTDVTPVVVPRERSRRRAAGRAAGAPQGA